MKNASTFKLALLSAAGIIAGHFSASAQISDCSMFLLGDKIEAGVNWNGALGASAAPPTGSHANWSTSLYNSPRCTGSLYTGISLGVIADPDEDGWTTGATPFYGDFILPGGANEGWSLMFNGEQKNAWNSDAATHDSIDNMTAYIYGFTDTLNGGTTIEAKTQSNYNGVYLTQFVTLNKSKLYMTITVIIENMSLSAAGDMYYMRWVNPHNDQSISGNASTWNRILYQAPDTGNRAVVTSRGSIYNNAYMALATKDFRATAFIDKHGQIPNANTIDLLNFGDTSCMYGLNDSLNTNAAIGIIYDLGTINSGGGAVLTYYYVFRPDILDEALYSNHLGVQNIGTQTAQFTAFPNPVQRSFSVQGMQPNDELVLFDITGRQVAYKTLSNNTYSIEELPAGAYVGMVKAQDGMTRGHIRLQKL